MGIYDRDYYRRPTARPMALDWSGWSVTTWLLVINVVIFFLDPILFRAGIRCVDPGARVVMPPLYGLGRFSLDLGVYHFELWRVITFQFLHANLTHLFFNMFSLFFFGPMIESYLGRGKFLAFYLLCGIGGPISYVLLSVTHFLINDSHVALVGASAGIFGVLIAASQIAPNATVFVFGILPMQLKNVAWLLIAIAVYTILRYGTSGQGNAGGEAAHIGGAAVGYLLIRYPHLLRLPSFGRNRRPPF